MYNYPFDIIFNLLLSINKITTEECNSGTRLINIIPTVHGTKGAWFWDLMYLLDHLYRMFTQPDANEVSWEKFQEQPFIGYRCKSTYTMAGLCASTLPTSRTCCICCGRLASASITAPNLVVGVTNGECWKNAKHFRKTKVNAKNADTVKLLETSQYVPGRTCLKDECYHSELMDNKQSRYVSRNIAMIDQQRGAFEDLAIRKTTLLLANGAPSVDAQPVTSCL